MLHVCGLLNCQAHAETHSASFSSFLTWIKLKFWRTVVVKRELSRKAKLRCELTYILTLTCGHELWIVTDRTRLWMQAADMSFLCNVAFERRTQTSGVSLVEEMKLSGHLIRMPPWCLPLEVFEACLAICLAQTQYFLALAKNTWRLLVFFPTFFFQDWHSRSVFCARGNTKSLLTYLLGSHSVRPLWLNFPWRFRCSLNDFMESPTCNSDWLKRVVPCLNGDFPLVTSGWKDSLSSFAWICFGSLHQCSLNSLLLPGVCKQLVAEKTEIKKRKSHWRSTLIFSVEPHERVKWCSHKRCFSEEAVIWV